MIKSATIAAMVFIGLAGSQAVAWDGDFFGNYLERKDTIVSGAGDARDVNAATQIIDPWPRYVGNRRIPANGERMSGAVKRYRENTPWEVPCPITPTFDIQQAGIATSTERGCAKSRATNAAANALNNAAATGAPVGIGIGVR
jgi:hypothetical protein